jgi:hypothetical protein
MSTAVSGGPSSEKRAQYKASLILKLLEYVTWESGGPAKGEAIVIGVIDDQPLARKMTDLSSFSALDPKPKVRELKTDDDFSACHVIYMSASDMTGAETVVDKIGDQKIFTISDADGLIQSGVMVNFIQPTETNVKEKFEVNLTQVQDKSMKISSKFLKLARVYEGTAGNLVLNE